jgi:cellulose synthase/poly-beta-1,6-N-acetylglucosamine synthase-like glycosyltransferase
LKRLAGQNSVIKYPDNVNSFNTLKITSDLPLVSVIIPVYNEEAVIERRIENIHKSRYPKEKIETIVVDSGSTDKTRSIVQNRFSNTVILIHEEIRKGKAQAINLALKKCNGEIVIITDGPTMFDEDTIPQLVNALRDASVGGVSALYRIPNAKENQVTASEQAFWLYKDKIRILEGMTYSTSWLSGEACAFKQKIITKIDEDTLADDSNIALQIISKRYRVVVNSNSYFTEKSPAEVYEYFKIKARRILGGLIETLRFKFFLFNRKYGSFGLVIFPYRFFSQFVNPIASNIALIMSIFAVIEVSRYLGVYGILAIGVSLLAAALVFRDKLMAYFYLQIISSLALVMLLTKRRQVLWSQSKTTRL